MKTAVQFDRRAGKVAKDKAALTISEMELSRGLAEYYGDEAVDLLAEYYGEDADEDY